MRVVSFKIEEDLYELLVYHSRITGRSQSEIIRAALRHYFEQERFKRPFVTRRIRIWG